MNDNVTKPDGTSTPGLSALAELTPKTVILDMLAIAGELPLTSTVLAGGGGIMGFRSGTMRTALSRLAGQHLIESPRRGEWQLAPEAPWAREQARWQHLETLVRPWRGAWWVVITHQSPRSSRSSWRHHERALLQRGFREIQRDLFVRPANLALEFDTLHRELTDLGLHPDSLLLEATTLSVTPDPGRWHSAQRQAVLHEVLREMRTLMGQAGGADRRRCERFLRVGRAATRALNTDPLLPEEWTGPTPRAEVIALLPRFIATGRALWFRHLNVDTADAGTYQNHSGN